MSLERYKSNQNIGKEVEAQRKPNQSPIRTFANMIIEDAATELISLNRGENSPIRSAITVDRPTNKEDLAFYTKDVEAMVYFGNIIIAMENIIIDGEYDHKAFCDSVNQSIGNYGKYEIEFIEEPYKPNKNLTEEEKVRNSKNVARIAQDDPTLATFIEFADDLLPALLLEVLEEKGVKERVQKMTENYKKITKQLVQKQYAIYSSRDVQGFILGLFDIFIEKNLSPKT